MNLGRFCSSVERRRPCTRARTFMPSCYALSTRHRMGRCFQCAELPQTPLQEGIHGDV
eukprot:s1069_g9.t1